MRKFPLISRASGWLSRGAGFVFRLAGMVRLLQLQPFETGSGEGRAMERKRRILLSGISGVAAKGIALLTTIVSVPLTLHYLGPERYGMWMTISSIFTMMAFLDLGLGNGLVNATSEADGKGDVARVQRSIAAVFFLLTGICLVAGLALWGSWRWVAWPGVFNVSAELAVREARTSVLVFGLCFLTGVPASVVQRVQMGYQEGFATNLWQTSGAVLGLAMVLVAIYCRAGLPWLILAMAGSPVLMAWVNFLWQFCRVRPHLLPRLGRFSWPCALSLMRLGWYFFVLQVLTLIGTSIDYLIITHALGPEAVANYSVGMRLATMFTAIQFFIAPMWPAFGEALSRGDREWAERVFWKTLKLTVLLAVPAAAVLWGGGNWIIGLWVGPDVRLDSALLAGLGGWVFMICYGGLVSVLLLNCTAWIKDLVKLYTLGTVVSLLLKVVLVQPWHEAGVIWATVIGYVGMFSLPATFLVRRIFRELRAGPGAGPAPSIPI